MASIKLFGYLFYEVEGREKILVSIKTKNTWDFSINTEINSTVETLSKLDGVVEQMIRDKIISFGTLVEGNLDKYSLIEIPNSQSQFVKIKVRKHTTSTDKFKWVDKEIFFKKKCQSKELLNRILNDYIFHSHGQKILECVDAIVYRQWHGAYEFLLLRRKISNSNEYKSEYPKGGLKYHETVLEGAMRELKEETGVDSYTMKNYLGLKVVDVRDRKREYDIIRVHGLAFEYRGSGTDITPLSDEGFDKIYDWVSFDEALKKIWMKTYGVEFLKTLKSFLS